MEELVRQILQNEKILSNSIKKSTSGFTNCVFFIDDIYVIKLTNDKERIFSLQKEKSIYKNLKFDFMPRFVAGGNYNGYEYLIITKLEGETLFQIWHKLESSERRKIVRHIAEILEKFNQQDFSFLDDKFKDLNWTETIENNLKNLANILNNFGYDIEDIKTFINNDLQKIFSNNVFGLVYNDAHFDNFLYKNGKLSLIDFDRVRYCPIDYEMLIFKTMYDNPAKFASEVDEPNVKKEDYLNVYDWFREDYKKMFVIPYIEKRIFVYQFIYLMEHAIDDKKQARIKELLEEFKNSILFL